MCDDGTVAEELAALVADARELADAWNGVGTRALPWRATGPDWPAVEPPASPPTIEASPALRPRQPPVPGTAAPVLFPARQPKPRTPAPRRHAPDGPGRWQGYGHQAQPEQAMARVRADLGDCKRCPLHRTRSHLVFGVGSPGADLVVVGEAPGFHEDRQGEPFVGAAGQMLDRMLVHVLGLQREQVYIMNVLKCRPPENRDPEPPEVQACRPLFDAQLNVIRPQVILALGRYATQSLLGTTRGIKSMRGRWASYRGVAVMPTFHPAYLLRNPADKRLTLQDLLVLKERLAQGR